jgi:putative ABC transport system permease protein
MKTSDLVASAVSNTFRSKLRTTLTVLALFVGAFTLTLTTAVGAGVTDYVTKQVDSLGASDVFIISGQAQKSSNDGPAKYDPKTSTASNGTNAGPLATGGALTESDMDDLKKTPGLTQVSPVRSVAFDYIQNGSGTKYEFTSNPASAITKADLVAGDQLSSTSTQNQVVLPSDYVEPLGFEATSGAVGQKVTLGLTDILGHKHTVEATVVGVAQKSLLATGAGISQELTNTAANLQQAGINTDNPRYAIATAHFDDTMPKADIDALKQTVVDKGFSVQTIQDQLGVITTVIAGIVGVLNAFAIVALIAASFGIINTLLMSVQERTREIGLMKAMGMGSGKVFALFSLEAIFIGFLGSAIGALAAAVLGTGISSALSAGPLAALPGLNILMFEPASILAIILLIMTIAFLSGTLPARKAARQNPIESLRYE